MVSVRAAYPCHDPRGDRSVTRLCFVRAAMQRVMPSAVRAPVLHPPCIVHRPFAMAASEGERPSLSWSNGERANPSVLRAKSLARSPHRPPRQLSRVRRPA